MVLATGHPTPEEVDWLPAEGLESYIQGMLDNGFSAAEVKQMVSQHAQGLLEI